MNNRTLFRLLVVATNIGIVLITFLALYLDNGELDAAYEALPESSSLESLLENMWLLAGVSIAAVLVWIGSIVGVLMFKNWGRVLTVIGAIVGYPAIAFLGPSIEFGWESAFNEFANLLFGVILAAMYLPPISQEFNKEGRLE
jgi:magnesium-transporting ATPase (P-type)